MNKVVYIAELDADIDDIIAVEYLNSKDGGNHDYVDIATNLRNIKIIIEAIVGQINLNDIFSKPLTKEVEDKLIFKSAVCWD